MSAPTICETLPAQEYAGGRVYQDEEGNWHVERTSSGWTGVNEVRVAWTASGGAAPYTLQIDGEPRDVAGAYAGANGTASVSCALRSSGVFFPHPLDEEHRRYRTEPEVDSGLKTIRAVVTDGSGATAEASVEVYVILELGGSGSILERGKTYRVFGLLLTVPESYDVGWAACPSRSATTFRRGRGARRGLWLVGTGAHLALYATTAGGGERTVPAQRSARCGWARGDRCSTFGFAEFDSVNRQPNVAGGGQ